MDGLFGLPGRRLLRGGLDLQAPPLLPPRRSALIMLLLTPPFRPVSLALAVEASPLLSPRALDAPRPVAASSNEPPPCPPPLALAVEAPPLLSPRALDAPRPVAASSNEPPPCPPPLAPPPSNGEGGLALSGRGAEATTAAEVACVAVVQIAPVLAPELEQRGCDRLLSR